MRALLALTCILTGCATDPIFDEIGFVHPRYGYHIGYGSGTRGVWLSGDWRVENYGTRSGRWVHREAAQYWHEPSLDLDGDGIPRRLPREYIYDLRLRHVRSNGMIWVRTVLLELDQH